jgi:hypothetical protein
MRIFAGMALEALLVLSSLAMVQAQEPAKVPGQPRTPASEMARTDEKAHPYPDCIGIYFDGEATQYCRARASGQMEAYLFLINPTDSTGVIGWECRIDVDVPEGNYFAGFELRGDCINAANAPDFAVGLGTCLPWADIVHLATLKLIVVTSEPWHFYIRPALHASVEGRAAYAPCANPSNLIAMQPVSGDPDEPVAWINAPCEVDTESHEWDKVKTLYR